MNAHVKIPTKATKIKPGIYFDMPNEHYHSGPGISKSGLWTIHDKTPAHFKFPPPPSEETTQAKAAKDFGTATHVAILEPDQLEKQVYRGPEDRRGNPWKDAVEFCALEKKTLLIADAYDEVLAIRDVVHADPWLNSVITGGKPMIEASGYFIDPETGELCRVRPDLYREDLKLILDVKTAVCAAPTEFARAVDKFGYHAQEAFYTDGWQATGKPVEAFAFLVLEKKAPYAFAVYELPPPIVEEGRAIMRQALGIYSECRKADKWPGYPAGVQELPIKKWSYRLTQAPDVLDEEAA